jgi:galactokinase
VCVTEHVDYTSGYVLPLAISFGTAVVGLGSVCGRSSGNVKIVSNNSADKSVIEVSLRSIDDVIPSSDKSTSWSNYIIGVVLQYIRDLPNDLSLDLTLSISGNVPLGSGLSSSASLEVAVGRFCEEVFCAEGHGEKLYESCETTYPTHSIGRAIRCQKAENDFCSSPCGIMDQYISSCGLSNSLLLIDCLTNTFSPVPFNGDDVALIVANSKVTHSIGGGEYPKRVEQCIKGTEVVAKANGKETLRHCDLDDLERKKGELDEVTYKRCHHVITENMRTLGVVEKLAGGDYASVGKSMTESHASLDGQFEVTCEELNILQAISLRYPGPGVYGARMTGGGFGGCVITLVEKGKEKEVMDYIEEEYRKAKGVSCEAFCSTAAEGANGGSV